MEPQCSHGEQERRPQGGGQGGSQEPAVVHQPEGDHLHLETILGSHATEDAVSEGRIHDRSQHTEVPRKDAGVLLNAVVLLPAVVSVEGVHRAREKDGGVGLHQHFSGGGSALLQGCGDRKTPNIKCPARRPPQGSTALLSSSVIRQQVCLCD